MNIVEKEITDRKGRKFNWQGPENGLSGTFSEMLKQRKRGQAQMLQDVKNLELRDDDIMVCTFSKSGTHWIWEIVNMVVKEKADYDRNAKEVAMLEFQTPSSLEPMPSPRVLNCHMFADDLPLQVRSKKVKVIHVLRNPKDVAVSFFHFSKKLPMMSFMENKPFETFSEYLPYFTGEYGMYYPSSIFEYYKQMEKFITDYPDQTLHLCFENMKKNPVEAVEKVAKFLNKDLSRSVIEEIADKCSFDKLKKADETKDKSAFPALSNVNLPKVTNNTMYRKGEIGDWKNHFTVAENEEFDKLLEKHLKNSKFDITFS